MMKNNVIRPFMEVYNLETFIYCSRISDGSYEILINNFDYGGLWIVILMCVRQL